MKAVTRPAHVCDGRGQRGSERGFAIGRHQEAPKDATKGPRGWTRRLGRNSQGRVLEAPQAEGPGAAAVEMPVGRDSPVSANGGHCGQSTLSPQSVW